MFISIALMATSVLCVDFSAAAADDELTALAAGSDTYKAYYYLNFSDYAYFLNTYRSVYQTNLENLADNKPYQAMLTAWRVATFNIASEVDYAKKEIGYYETLLFDLLYDEQSGTIFQSFMSEYSDLTKTANSVQKALSASTFKKVSDLYGKIAKDTPATDPQYLEALKVLKNCSTVSEAANLLGDISTLTDYAGTFYELVENMCKVQVVLDSAKEINLLLDEISKKSNDNIALQTAIAEFKGFTDDTVDRSFAVAVFSGETVLAEGLKYVAKKIYKSVLERANLYGLAVGVGQAVGKFAADTLFGTSDSVNSYYHLRAVFRFETLLRQVVQSFSTRSDVTTNTATAKQFNTGVVLLCKTYIAGLKVYKTFIQKNYHSGTLGDYVNGISDAEYEQLMTSVDDLIASIKSAIAFNESVADRLYAENVQVYADEIYQMQIPTIDTGISETDYAAGLSTVKQVSASYAGVIEKSTTLTANTVMYGDVQVKENLDLNGYSLTVTGSLNHTYGGLTLNGGTLNVGKDYIGAKVVTNAEGKKEYLLNGNWHDLYMKNANDRMTVGGNFIECENGEMNKGVLRVGGNVESYNGFDYGAEHTTILDGQQHQIIMLPSGSHFGVLRLTKDVSNYTFEPEACWFKVIYADCAHQYVHKVLQPATCTSDGRERCTCTICGQVKEVLIPATAHDYQSEVVAATCSQSGYTQYTCTVCGYSYRTDYTQPGAHSFVKTTVAATCTAAGYDCYTCSVCGSAYTTGFTAPLGHDLQVIQTDDQSESNGHIFEYLRCARCMDTATDTIRTTHVTDASGHYVWKAGCYQDQVVQAGDCTHKKIVVRVCTVEDPTGNGNCTAQLRTESEAPGHRVEQWTVTLDPTCATDGQRTGTCAVCREEVHQVIAAAPEYGHILQYSGSEPGVCIYTCTRCGVTERRRAAVVEAQFFDHMGAADKSALGYVYDLNKDGTINLRDYVLLQRIAAAGT